MAPPLLARAGPDGRPRKMRLGPWLMPALRALAAARRLRGRWLDPFGHTEERRLERQLARDYETLIAKVLTGLAPDKHSLAVAIARTPEGIRGYGHVKLANLASARARWRELVERFDAPTGGVGPARPTIPIAAAEANA